MKTSVVEAHFRLPNTSLFVGTAPLTVSVLPGLQISLPWLQGWAHDLANRSVTVIGSEMDM